MTTLTVYQLPGVWGLVSLSPFCLKLDAFLRMTAIPHRAVIVAAPFAGPKKKAPWIEHGQLKLGDSSFIIDHLTQAFGVDPDRHLTAAQRGQAVAIQRLVEENLYWAMVHDRWVREENWPILKGSVLGRIPTPIRTLIAPLARGGVQKQLKGHGLGLHSDSDIQDIARRDIGALASMLGDQAWFFGPEPSLADATVFSLLANIRYPAFASPMKSMIEAHPRLAAFVDRFRDRFYGQSTD